MAQLLRPLLITLALFASLTAYAIEPARFDLAGPKVDVRVTRAGKMLPIASVPNLVAGDTIWLHPELPPTQSVRYLMVVVFLRGTTNPPPDQWFTRVETWQKKVREEGVEVVVPDEAQQAIVFLAPVTGGDFTTLRSAVRGRPGIFVRASQDLNEAGFEQSRIEQYLAAMRQVPPGDAKALQDHSNLLARTLALRPNAECFKRDVDQQLNCLTQTGNQTLLDDGHGQTVADALTTGMGSDFINAASLTQAAGAYSAYVGAIVDLGRILTSLHTAQYQYIPAIAFPQQESLNLRLNTPPSFNNPKSVIVIGLPAIQKSTPPPMRHADPRQIACLLQSKLTIPIEGAPLVFSTGFAHDLVLHLNTTGSNPSPDIPLRADAYQGGLVLAAVSPRHMLVEPETPSAAQPTSPAPAEAALRPASLGPPLTGTIKGFWGFDPFDGPTIALQDAPGQDWKILSGEPLIAGHEDHIVLGSTGTACLESITFDAATGVPGRVLTKRPEQPGQVDVTLPLGSATPGSLKLAIHQFGSPEPVALSIKTYSEPARLAAITLHAGDRTALLTGQHLNQVLQMRINDLHFSPVAGSSSDALSLTLPDAAPTPTFRMGDPLAAHLALADGRFLDLPFLVSAARPSLTLRSLSTTHDANAPIKLSSKDDLRVDQAITLILKSTAPISRTEEIEFSTQDGSLSTRLNFSSGALVLQDSHTLRVTLDPLKALGPSVFGPVRLRAIQANSDPGDWIPLGTLVRVPAVSALTCPSDAAKTCTLTGSSLFLLDSIASDEAFADPTPLPEDFSDSTLPVPHPNGGLLYVRLRDDRATPATLSLPVQPEPMLTRPSAHGASPSATKN